MTRNVNQRSEVATSPACLVCGSTSATHWADANDVEYCTRTGTFAYWHCAKCDVLFIDPVPASRLAEIYPSNYYSYAAPGGSVVHNVKRWLDRRAFRQLLRSIPGTSLRILDVGGGAGWELRTLRQADARVEETHVVDLDPAAAEQAEKNGHVYHCGRIEDYSASGSFNLVLMLNLIEHVQDPRAVLAKARSLLTEGGRVLVKTPNFDAWDARLFRNASWAGYHCPRHWVLFTQDSLRRLANEVDLDVIEAEYTQGAPFWAASVLSRLERVGLASITRERPVVYHPLFGPLAALFAGLDFLRRPLAKTSQMVFVLTPKQRGVEQGG